MKHTIEHNKVEQLIMRNAMQIHLKSLNESERAVYGVAYQKVVESNGILKLDGMEMRSITNSLEYLSDKFNDKGLGIEAYHYHNLSIWMSANLRNFQSEFAKKIDLSNRDVLETAI